MAMKGFKSMFSLKPVKAKAQSNGYVIYPEGVGKSALVSAVKEAVRQSQSAANQFEARIENVDTEKVVARYRNGQQQ